MDPRSEPDPAPIPAAPAPPPPGRAEGLVARAGVTVYEEGRTVFDEPVLVYLPIGRRSEVEFDVVDHLGRLRAMVRAASDRPRWAPHRRPLQVFDPYGNPILGLRLDNRPFQTRFRIDGVASAEAVVSLGGMTVTLQADGEPYGTVAGGGLSGLRSGRADLVDHLGHRVGRVVPVSEPAGPLSRRRNLVMECHHGFPAPFRRLAVAVPPMLAAFRLLAQESG